MVPNRRAFRTAPMQLRCTLVCAVFHSCPPFVRGRVRGIREKGDSAHSTGSSVEAAEEKGVEAKGRERKKKKGGVISNVTR
mmetsp:Transcript_22611/g.70099  ORF Transcript_22611/g.70099 Transcript_22611/m.70099 type:complete len:81 (+) Transcript_22611:99-341(+)